MLGTRKNETLDVSTSINTARVVTWQNAPTKIVASLSCLKRRTSILRFSILSSIPTILNIQLFANFVAKTASLNIVRLIVIVIKSKIITATCFDPKKDHHQVFSQKH